MNVQNTAVINILEIKERYQSYCNKNKIKFTTAGFNDFLKYLEIDFYDWIKENLRTFDIQYKTRREQ